MPDDVRSESSVTERVDANTVPVPNLTREDARQRAGLLRVESYDVTLDLTDADGGPSERIFRSRTVVTFAADKPGASTFIDVVAERFHEVSLNGTPIDVSGYEPDEGIVLPGLAADNVLVVDADLLYTTIGQGLHRFVDPVDDAVYLYTQFETTDSKRMYACFDQPDLKATFSLHVTAPAAWTVVSNGAVETVEDDEETKTVHFTTTPRMSTYITALVAGPYHEVRDHHDGIDLGLFCRRSLAQYFDPDEMFTVTKQGFDWYHENFGVRYAFGKYDQLFVPEFNAGAMENAGCVTFLEDYVFRSRVTDARYERRAGTILHEMAHMWFGDLVTMKWFDDLWLNESFADWAATQSQSSATRWKNSWTSFTNLDKTWAYRQDQLPSTHPIACEIPDAEAVEVNFDGITYAKGASVLKQLAAYVGLDEFLAGVRKYFADNAYGNTTLPDFLAALNATSGRELSDWAKVWLETSGLNTITPHYTVDADGRFSSFTLIQDAPTVTAKDNVLRPHRLAVGLYNYDDDGQLVRTKRVELDLTGERTEVAELIGESRADFVLANDDDLTYCKLRLDERSLATLRAGGLGALTDSLARAVCWVAAWDMVRDGELATHDYLDLVIAGAPSETEIGVVQSAHRQLLRALQIYADPAWAATGRERFADVAIDAARSATAGSDHQLAWVHAVIGAATTAEQTEFLSSLFDGRTTLDGLSMDTDLRWALVQALVARGALGVEAIDEQAAADKTAAGVRAAATARALIPTREAKEAAWHAVFYDDSLSNAVMRATLGGFSHPLQGELIAPFGERYFTDAASVWARRTSEMAQDAVVGLFPSWSSTITDRIVELADEFLADTSRPASLRRLVSEGRADVVRALKARSVDAG
ncbi:aminopeptidase N [Jatrophihabitans telluris]|uniref:Aminopeptidase N n=1 Tax=Jatrophihabitans telluris TaxID=2038343 RepID=A0ABY4R165_9ACTN|nr:aminopeptidase N [Jatrophihabitans telluris]UQX89651.1 aminopeptidase N [Jatrophihabitans telluris]